VTAAGKQVGWHAPQPLARAALAGLRPADLRQVTGDIALDRTNSWGRYFSSLARGGSIWQWHRSGRQLFVAKVGAGLRLALGKPVAAVASGIGGLPLQWLPLSGSAEHRPGC
jgi:hypothetical protein